MEGSGGKDRGRRPSTTNICSHPTVLKKERSKSLINGGFLHIVLAKFTNADTPFSSCSLKSIYFGFLFWLMMKMWISLNPLWYFSQFSSLILLSVLSDISLNSLLWYFSQFSSLIFHSIFFSDISLNSLLWYFSQLRCLNSA